MWAGHLEVGPSGDVPAKQLHAARAGRCARARHSYNEYRHQERDRGFSDPATSPATRHRAGASTMRPARATTATGGSHASDAGTISALQATGARPRRWRHLYRNRLISWTAQPDSEALRGCDWPSTGPVFGLGSAKNSMIRGSSFRVVRPTTDESGYRLAKRLRAVCPVLGSSQPSPVSTSSWARCGHAWSGVRCCSAAGPTSAQRRGRDRQWVRDLRPA
jgi:hypothetical protein